MITIIYDSNTIILANNDIRMRNLSIRINVNSALYLKNPDTSSLGNKIIFQSIQLIYELGFESFTFKKLSQKINSPESSIYRYFENKHTLLVYLTSWYWGWTAYRIILATTNIDVPVEKLKIALQILTKEVPVDESFSYVDEVALHKIIIAESVKAFHTKDIDKENKKGCFDSYKFLINRVAAIILEVNPNFKFPYMFITTVIEGVLQQKYFSEHLPSLIDHNNGEDTIVEFYTKLVFDTILKDKTKKQQE